MSEKPGNGYLLIEYIDRPHGRIRSVTWDEKRHDANLQTNLFRGLSRVILGISSIPLPRIESFTIDSRGFLSLSNLAGHSHLMSSNLKTSTFPLILDLEWACSRPLEMTHPSLLTDKQSC